MKLGLVTPAVTRLPRAHADWEETAGIEEIARIAVEAERLGYHHLTCSEHVALPTEVVDTRGATYWDPLATFGYIAARTTTIRLATHVLVLGYHHPLAIAKRYGTLDRVSGGRLVLGVGVGSLEEEFDLLGVEFEGRGERGDDAIRALRASLSQRRARRTTASTTPTTASWSTRGRCSRACRSGSAAGRHGRCAGRSSSPTAGRRSACHAPQPHGHDRPCPRSEAWTARAALADAPPFELVLQNEHPFDPGAEPERVADAAAGLAEAGATTLNVRFVHHSLEHYLEQLAAMRELVG